MTEEKNITLIETMLKTDADSAYDRGVALHHSRETYHSMDADNITHSKLYTIGQMKYIVNSIFPRVCSNTADENIKHLLSREIDNVS